MGDLERSLRRMRWHLIDGGAHLATLDPQTRVITYLPFLTSLRDAGREHTELWLDACADDVGRRSTADLAGLSSLVA